MLDTGVKNILRTTSRHLKRLENLGIKTVRDFALFFPRTYTDSRNICKITEMKIDEINTIKAKVKTLHSQKTRARKTLTKALVEDNSGSIEVVWFNQPHITRLIPKGSTVILRGKLKTSMGRFTLSSPEYEIEKKEQIHTARIVPIYHETEGISSKWLREKLKPIIDAWSSEFEEYMPKEILEEHGLINLQEAIKTIHFPANKPEIIHARRRLSFDELFLIQFQALKKKWEWQKENVKEKIKIDSALVKSFVDSLPFELTEAQKTSAKEILKDLQKSCPMSRLVQGDVGSGKTVVAAIAILVMAKTGQQVSIMAPTEILAKQHKETLDQFLNEFGIETKFISGSIKAKEKKEIIEDLKTGKCQVIIGTHALIQEKIKFKNLGLAIVDEQHRFGVKQRAILKSHGTPHLLTLTATPIPRTLAMTIYGDQDLSIIDEMPKGRKPIITRIVPEDKRRDAYKWIKEQIEAGHQAFIVCPLIDESDVIEVKAVNQEFNNISNNIFPEMKVGLLHGKLKQEEKDKIMEKFKNNETNILVSTSVIEVGIDVPNANIMIIEGSERFGLSQLHQFRGRVGRGDTQSYCLLFTNSTSFESQKRLYAMTKHTSGFKLSEIDMQLRGPGEIYGVKQSGIPDLKMASLTDSKMIAKARASAEKLIGEDPHLKNHPLLKEKLTELEEIFVKD
jgi:ATP-dependent DNA helicase RecG